MFSPVLWLSVILGTALLFASPTTSKPVNATFYDSYGCQREKAQYIILAESGSGVDYFGNILPALRQIGLGLLRNQNTQVGFCVYGSDVYCDDTFEFDSMESKFLSLLNFNDFDTGSSNPSRAIYEALKRFDDPNVNKKLVMIQGSNIDYSVDAQRARDAGVEIFAIGRVRDSSVSHPIESHLVFCEENEIKKYTTPLLSLMRKQKSDTCHAWGIGLTHVLTFDGLLYDFSGVGDYYLFKTDEEGEDRLTVQVRQLTRPANPDLDSDVTQIRGVAVQMTRDSYVINYDPDLSIIEFNINGGTYRPMDFDDANDGSGYGYSFKKYRSSDSVLYLRLFEPYGGYVVSIESDFGSKVNIIFSDYISSVSVEPVGTAYSVSGGLCGNFDGCDSNDLTLRDKELLDSSSDKRVKKSAPEFIENWRVEGYSESIFDLRGFEQYTASSSWKPFTSTKGHKNADKVCDGLPDSLQKTCLFDVGARQHVYGSFASKFLVGLVCSKYCYNKNLPFLDIFDVENTCRIPCLSMDVERVDADLHKEYNITQIPSNLIRAGENSALFKPTSNMGGAYTFTLKSNDRCLEVERNITFRITCDAAPTVQANSYFNTSENTVTNLIQVRLTKSGSPFVSLFGSISSSSKNSPNFRASWKVINATLPYSKNVEEIDFPFDSRIEEAQNGFYLVSGLFAIFQPPWVGTFIIELAVSDGCQVVRSTVTVESMCSKCEPLARIATYDKNLWNKNNGGTGYWSDSTLSLNLGGLDPNFYFTNKWSLVSKDGASVEAIDEDSYQVYKLLQTRAVLKTNTTVAKSSTPPNVVSVESNGYPYSQSSSPYTIPELRTVETEIVWTETTETVYEETYRNEKRENLCVVDIDSYQSRYTEIFFSDDADFPNELAKCKGFYTFQASVSDACNPKEGRTVTDSAILHLDCGLPPRVFLSCNHRSIYNYGGYDFTEIFLDGSSTYDPRPGANHNGNHLHYTWEVISTPLGSNIQIDEIQTNDQTNYFRPDIKGSYVIRFTASNNCNKESAIVTVDAVCENAPVVDIIQVDNAKKTFDGSYGSPSFALNSTATHKYQSNLRYEWTVVSQPQFPPKLVGFIFPPEFDSPSAEDTPFYATYQGSYTLNVAVSDGCQLPVNKTINVEYVCPGSITPSVASIPATVDFDYDNNQFFGVVLDGSASSASAGSASYTPSPVQYWVLLSDPKQVYDDDNTYTGALNWTFTPSNPNGIGKYSFRYIYTDKCLWQFIDVSFNTICSHTPTPTPVIFTEGPIIIGNLTYIGDSSNDPKNDLHSWRVVSAPKGYTYNPSNIIAKTVNMTFTPTVPGTYTFEVTANDRCKTGAANITVTVICPPVPYSANAALVSTTSTYSKGKFSRVEMYDTGAGLAGIEPVNFNYRWIVTSAPVGSIYQPYDKLNVTEEVTFDNDTGVAGPDNSTYVEITTRVVTYRRNIRYVEIANADDPSRTFASCFYPDMPGTYRVKLTIVDSAYDIDDACYSRNSSELTVQVGCNSAPVINAPDQTVTLSPNKYTRVNIDASATVDADGDALTYLWEPDQSDLDNKNLEQLSSYGSPIASFIVYAQGTYSIRLTVSDGCQNTTRIVTITADCPTDDVVPDKKAKKIEEIELLVSSFDGKDIAYQEFDLVFKTVSEICTGEFTWEPVSYDVSDIVTTAPFTSTKGFIALVVIVPTVGAIGIAVAVFFIIKKAGVIKTNNVQMEPW